MTPEAAVKKKLNTFLDSYAGLYRYMPVSNGMGTPSLDYLICYRGQFAGIETKAGTKKMTARQEATAEKIRRAGGKAFLINEDEATWHKLKLWLDSFWE